MCVSIHVLCGCASVVSLFNDFPCCLSSYFNFIVRFCSCLFTFAGPNFYHNVIYVNSSGNGVSPPHQITYSTANSETIQRAHTHIIKRRIISIYSSNSSSSSSSKKENQNHSIFTVFKYQLRLVKIE